MPSLHDPRVSQNPLDEQQLPSIAALANTAFARLNPMERGVVSMQGRLDGQPASCVYLEQTSPPLQDLIKGYSGDSTAFSAGPEMVQSCLTLHAEPSDLRAVNMDQHSS